VKEHRNLKLREVGTNAVPRTISKWHEVLHQRAPMGSLHILVDTLIHAQTDAAKVKIIARWLFMFCS
jgi:hypothetical protein